MSNKSSSDAYSRACQHCFTASRTSEVYHRLLGLSHEHFQDKAQAMREEPRRLAETFFIALQLVLTCTLSANDEWPSANPPTKLTFDEAPLCKLNLDQHLVKGCQENIGLKVSPPLSIKQASQISSDVGHFRNIYVTSS